MSPAAITAIRAGLNSPERLKAIGSRGRSVAFRLGSGLRQPKVVLVLLLATLSAIVIFQGPLSRFLGAPADIGSPAATAPGTLSPNGAAQVLLPHTAAPEQVAAVRLHPPRDPFAALISFNGSRVPMARMTRHAEVRRPRGRPSGHSTASRSRPRRHTLAVGPPTSGASGCSASYVVRAGDTLWSIASRQLHPATPSAIARGWQRIYAGNQAVIGNNPSLLMPGATLCLGSG